MTRGELAIERLTYSVIGAFYEVYNTLGFGFLEHLYVMALERELVAGGHVVGRELSVPVFYKGDELGRQRLDMIVDRTLVVEAKATHDAPKAAARQVFNYLRATNLEFGLVLHFGPEPRFRRVRCAQRAPINLDDATMTTGHVNAANELNSFHSPYSHAPSVIEPDQKGWA